MRPSFWIPCSVLAFLLACDTSADGEGGGAATTATTSVVATAAQAGSGSTTAQTSSSRASGTAVVSSTASGMAISCEGANPPPPSALRDAASAMVSGEWRELATENLNADLLYIDALGDYGSTAHTDWSDELVWDPCTQQILYVGAGHLRPYGFVRFHATTNAWTRTDQGLPACMYIGGYEGCFTHGYDNAAIDVDAHKLYFNAQKELFSFDLLTETWSQAALPAETPVGYGNANELVTPLGKLAFVINGALSLYDVGSGSLEEVATGLAMGPYHNVAVYSPRLEKLYFGGGNDSRAFFEMTTAKVVRQLPDTGANLHVAYSTLTYDPVTGWPLHLGDDGHLRTFDPNAEAWVDAVDPPFTEHALAAPLDDHGVVLFMVPQSLYKVFLYKP